MDKHDPQLAKFLATIDKSKFSVEGYQVRVEKPWGYELLLETPGSPYTSKIMHIKAGARESLQVHDSKTETYTILSGRAALLQEDKNGEMVHCELQPGTGYTTQVGQKHRLVGITDCNIFEASTPETGTTWRLEDDYHRSDETEAMRSEPNRGWKD